MGCRYYETPDEIEANKKAKIDQENKEINKLINLLRVVDEEILANDNKFRLYYYDRIFCQLTNKIGIGCYVEDKRSLLTRILCDICKNFEQNGISIDKYQDLIKWWREHKEQDKKRSEAEAKIARASALKKLTKAEKDALGIKD